MGDYLTHRLCLAAIAGIFVPLVNLHEIRGFYFLAISISQADTALGFLLVGFVFAWEKQQQQQLLKDWLLRLCFLQPHRVNLLLGT